MTLASLLVEKGYAVIRVYSAEFPDEITSLVPKNITPVVWAGTIYHKVMPGDADPSVHLQSVRDTLKAIMEVKGVHVENFMVGCESGVELTDELTNLWQKEWGGSGKHIMTNGTKMSRARRDKHEMGEAVRKAGVRAVKQELIAGGSFGDVEKFVDSCKDPQGNFRVVLKPVASAGSEGVYFATTLEECRRYYDEIFVSKNVFGHVNDSVLIQEFLEGKEYVVDSVSVDGIHKTVAIWEYDKRACNGAQFVYYGMRLYETEDGGREDALVKYMHSVLDALEVKHGPSHGEVMWTSTGPCLVEVGCRPHGGEGTFVKLADGPIGYNQLSVMIDAHENRSKFYSLPDRPKKLKGSSMEVCLVSHQEGTLVDIPLLPKIEELESFVEAEMKTSVGEHVPLTIDFITSPGAILLSHPDKSVVERDQERIHELEENGLFEIRRMRLETL